MSNDVLIDIFEYLELNEIEKSQLVSFQWFNVVQRNRFKSSLNKRRRIYRLIINIYHPICVVIYIRGMNKLKLIRRISDPKELEVLLNCVILSWTTFPKHLLMKSIPIDEKWKGCEKFKEYLNFALFKNERFEWCLYPLDNVWAFFPEDESNIPNFITEMQSMELLFPNDYFSEIGTVEKEEEFYKTIFPEIYIEDSQ